MAVFKILSDDGRELYSVSYDLKLDADGEEIIVLDDATFTYLKSGIPGLKGVAGDQGPQGDPGLDGIQGPVGFKGATGDQGPQGSPGLDGGQGPVGDKGPTGDQGIVGLKGPAGDQGATGLKGPTGDQGPVGNKGLTGDQGATGLKGPTGDQGAVGLKGPTGDQGAVGLKGPQGDQGLTGLKGPTGDAGPAGSGGGGQIYKAAKLTISAGTPVAYNGVVPFDTVKYNDTGFTVNAGTFVAPATIPASMYVRATYSYEFSSASSGKNALILRDGSFSWAGNANRSTQATIEREMVGISSAWFKPNPGEVIAFSLNSATITVSRGDASWATLEVRYDG